MKSTYLSVPLIALMIACGSQPSDVETKRKELETARKDFNELREKIDVLEKELQELDPEFAKLTTKAILVSTITLEPNPFVHKIEVRGAVVSRKNVLVSAQTGGTIDRVHVREGQRVSKGQLLVSLDADVIRNNIAELKTSLELASALYEKQSKLWEQKIGTEIQYLQAKNNKESLERRLATSYSQLDQALIKAPFSGTIDEVGAREGELSSPGLPLLRMTSPEDMYIKADVSERFIGRFQVGDKVDISFPIHDKTLQSTISSVSQVINQDNRTFFVEVKLPKTDWLLKPNQFTILHLTDYFNKDALTVPTRLIQNDDDGQYIFKIEKKDKKFLARKVHITAGVTYEGKTELLSGADSGLQVVDKGFRDLSEGVEVAVAQPSEADKVARN